MLPSALAPTLVISRTRPASQRPPRHATAAPRASYERCARAVALVLGASVLLPAFAHAQDTPSTPVPRSGIVAGLVRDSIGVPVTSAEVTMAGFIGRGATSSDGSFRIAAVPPGQRTLVVRRIGFRPESLAVEVRSGEVTEVNVRLDPVPMRIAPMIVQAGRLAYSGRMAAFHERRERGVGRFITAEQIDRRKPMRVTDMLRAMPGVSLSRQGSVSEVRFRGRNCAPLVWVDGAPASAGYFDIDNIMPHSVAGIELYSGPATVPAELMFVRSKGACGVVAIWTRVPEPQPRRQRLITARDLALMVQSLKLYTADQVQEPVALMAGDSIVPVYPDSLQRRGVPGHVLVEFIVDTTGRAEMDTFGAVITTDRLFTESVRRAISQARFTPARHEGRTVQQLVQLSFRFVLESTTVSNARDGQH